jgi:hypothetical protein
MRFAPKNLVVIGGKQSNIFEHLFYHDPPNNAIPRKKLSPLCETLERTRHRRGEVIIAVHKSKISVKLAISSL